MAKKRATKKKKVAKKVVRRKVVKKKAVKKKAGKKVVRKVARKKVVAKKVVRKKAKKRTQRAVIAVTLKVAELPSTVTELVVLPSPEEFVLPEPALTEPEIPAGELLPPEEGPH
jgi:hypothetical protein